ncbi:MAG: protease inhibitor I9 family protein, partial [Caldilineaceae bacterium]
MHLLLLVLALTTVAALVGPVATHVAFAQDLPAAPADPNAPFRMFLPMVQSGPDGAPALPPGEGQVPVAGEVIPGQYIVVLQPAEVRAAASPDGVTVSAGVFAQQTIDAYGGQLLFVYETVLPGFAAQLPDAALQALAQDPDVALVEPDQVVTVDVTQTPATWGLDRLDQRTL